ncbi:MAG TPA: protein-methionine-sulfoxide reductase heme-binding subunit MsrQ [Terriglobales bacterium]|nr:protein-methionine-sulfoxide reductase heme-binding subunit MsrQ [Terriglobales bacterium]
MSRRVRIVLKTAIWLVCLGPIVYLAAGFATGSLGTNPIDYTTDLLGDWTLSLLLVSLALTPLRILSGQAWPVAFRRLLGLFAFTYAVLHFSVWVVLDFFFEWELLLADIVERPYVTVGMSALLLLVPLAATSTAGMIKRLGARNWRRLHRLAYVAAALGVLHYFWLAKVGVRTPWIYATVLAVVLGIRVGDAARRRWKRASVRG